MHTTKNMNIYQAINEIMKELPAIPKERRLEYNGKLQYNFRGVDDIYSALQPLLIKYGVTSVPSATLVHKEQVETSKTFNGETKTTITNRVILSVQYTFYALDGSSIVSCVVGEGMDSGDKAANKAMSAAHKYALLQVFCIPTVEPKDSENDHHEVEKKSSSSLSPTAQTYKAAISALNSQSQDAGDYVCTFGKYKDQMIREAVDKDGQFKVASYCGWLESDAKVKKKPMGQNARDFIDAFNSFVGNTELDQALSATAPKAKDKNVYDQLTRLANQFPGTPGPPMPVPYKDDESPFPTDEEIPF